MASEWTPWVEATAHLEPPFAVVDLDAVESNARDLVRRAAGLPIRIASKSVRVRHIIDTTLARTGFAGIMAYSLREAIWLARLGHRDILLAYPSVDSNALAELRSDPELASSIVVVADCLEHLDLIQPRTTEERSRGSASIRVCLDIDCSLRVGPLHLGVRRSPLRTPAEARLLAIEVERRPGLELVGLMFYDAQIAGLPDTSPAVRAVKRLSDRDLSARRAAVIAALRDVADLSLINGGGTGSLDVTSRDRHLNELAAGSGLFGPWLFDGYRDFAPAPAAFFVSAVTRRPAPGFATTFSGGYIASGPPGWSRQPLPWFPRGLKLLGTEGAGEVQTPLRDTAARDLRVGDRVWFRHAKAGELCERFDSVHLISGGQLVAEVPTYRGEGKNFG